MRDQTHTYTELTRQKEREEERQAFNVISLLSCKPLLVSQIEEMVSHRTSTLQLLKIKDKDIKFQSLSSQQRAQTTTYNSHY